jgi:hypothetical protein
MPGFHCGNLDTNKKVIIIGTGHFLSFDDTAPKRKAFASAGLIKFNS